jgi:hypothetical protein
VADAPRAPNTRSLIVIATTDESRISTLPSSRNHPRAVLHRGRPSAILSIGADYSSQQGLDATESPPEVAIGVAPRRLQVFESRQCSAGFGGCCQLASWPVFGLPQSAQMAIKRTERVKVAMRLRHQSAMEGTGRRCVTLKAKDSALRRSRGPLAPFHHLPECNGQAAEHRHRMEDVAGGQVHLPSTG